MRKNISVFDVNGIKVKKTKVKGANKLVRKQHAIWVDNNTIKLIVPMQDLKIDKIKAIFGEKVQETQEVELDITNASEDELTKELDKFKCKYHREVAKGKVLRERRFFVSLFDVIIVSFILIAILFTYRELFVLYSYFMLKAIACLYFSIKNFSKFSIPKMVDYFISGSEAEVELETLRAEAKNN